jgi:hypothetical protein
MTITRLSAVPAVDSFGLALPAEWVRLPLRRDDEFEAFVRLQRRRLSEHGDLSRTAERRLELALRQLRNTCVREQITLAAMFAVPVDDESADLLAGTCTLGTVSQARLGTELPLTVNTLAAAISRFGPATTGGVEVAELEPPAQVTLPAGLAVKLVRLHTLPPDPATRERLQLFAEHYLVPFDGGRRAAALTFATPNVELARPLSTLFDEIAASFRMFAGDDPTDPVAA